MGKRVMRARTTRFLIQPPPHVAKKKKREEGVSVHAHHLRADIELSSPKGRAPLTRRRAGVHPSLTSCAVKVRKKTRRRALPPPQLTQVVRGADGGDDTSDRHSE